MAIITLSRQVGSGGDLIAMEVANRLNYNYIDKLKIYEIAEEYGLKKPELDKVDEKRPSFIDRFFNETHTIYLSILQSIIFDYARKDNVVVVGRGAQILLKDLKNTLHVQVVCHYEKRIERLMETEKITREIAEKVITTGDKDRAGYIKFLFNVDWTDKHFYDLIINTSKLSIDSAIDIILKAVNSPELARGKQESSEILEKLALTKKVEAALISDKRINPRLISVEVPSQGKVILRGAVSTEQEKLITEQIVRNIQEVKDLEIDLSVTIFPIGHLEFM